MHQKNATLRLWKGGAEGADGKHAGRNWVKFRLLLILLKALSVAGKNFRAESITNTNI